MLQFGRFTFLAILVLSYFRNVAGSSPSNSLPSARSAATVPSIPVSPVGPSLVPINSAVQDMYVDTMLNF
jgi:hypothetical protein